MGFSEPMDSDFEAETRLDVSGSYAAEARRFAAEAVREWGMPFLVDDAAFVATEFTSNAVVHTGGPFTLRLYRRGGTVRVAVEDHSPTFPRVLDLSTTSEAGRGLALVARLAERWGYEPVEAGKVVWADLRDPAELSPPRS